MKTNFLLAWAVWWKALLSYLLLTLPALVWWPVYAISAVLAVGWSLPGLLLYWALQPLLRAGAGRRWVALLHAGLLQAITLGCTLLAAIHITRGVRWWPQWQQYWLFPAAAMVATLLALLLPRSRGLPPALHSPPAPVGHGSSASSSP